MNILIRTSELDFFFVSLYMRVVATDLNNDVAISQKFSDNDIAISVLYRHIAQHESRVSRTFIKVFLFIYISDI